MARIMTTRAPEDLFKKLEKAAKKHGLTRNALILQILWKWVEEEKSERS